MVLENGTGASQEEISKRIADARGLMRAAGLEVLLVIGRSFYDRMGSLTYLTNHFPPFPPGAFSDTVRGMGHGVLVLPMEEEPLLFVDHRNYRAEMVHVEKVQVEANISAGLVNQLGRLGAGSARVGIAGEDIMPATMYIDLTTALPEAQFSNANALVEQLRAQEERNRGRLPEASGGDRRSGLRRDFRCDSTRRERERPVRRGPRGGDARGR